LVLLFPQGIAGSVQMLWGRWHPKKEPKAGAAP